MQINYKEWNLKTLGHLVMLSLVLVLMISVIMVFISPFLTTVLPTVFTGPLTLTNILLFLLVVLHITK